VNKDEDRKFREKIEGSVESYKTSKTRRREFWKYLSRATTIGWLFVIPVVAGAYLGKYLDTRFASEISWTITLIVIGIAVGIYNVWHFFGGGRLNERR